jgi:lysophospholipase L1-like esterase
MWLARAALRKRLDLSNRIKLPPIMKKVFLVASILLPFAFSAQADFLVQPNDVVGIAGDSITAQHLYSSFMEDYLLMCQPTQNLSVVQFGWSGEQAPGFLARLNTDVFPFKPTVITTCYGMNDGHYGPINDDVANTYRKAQTDIVEALKKNGVRAIVLGSSKCVDSHSYHGDPALAAIYNKTLGSLADIDKQIAQQKGVVYADVFGITMDAMTKAKAKFGEDYVFAGADGVHPGPNGHLVMAYAFLKALGCDGNIGTITVDYGAKQATATPGQEVVSYKDGTVDLKSTRYPFCFTGAIDSKDQGTTAAVSTCFPFNDDLNRYMLVVKGLTTAKAKITWGGTTKEYASADLAKGINLASEFLVNPFVVQFQRVHGMVQNQEQQETQLSQTFMHNVATWKQNFAPGADAAFDQVIASAMTQHNALFKQAADLVIPIQHTIKIEPST